MVNKEILKRLDKSDDLCKEVKSNIIHAFFLVEIIDRYLKDGISIGEIYSLNDLFSCHALYNFKFILIKCDGFVKIAVLDNIDNKGFLGKFNCIFKEKYVYLEDLDVALYLNEYIINKGLINVKKKYLDMIENVRNNIGGWMSSQLVDILYVMKECLKDYKDYYLIERYFADINGVISDIFKYNVRNVDEYIIKKANHLLKINDRIDSYIDSYFCNLESEQSFLAGNFDIECKVNEIKEHLESHILKDKWLMDKYFEHVVVPKYLFEKYVRDKERLDCIIRFNLLMQEIYEDIVHCLTKTNLKEFCIRINDEEYSIRLESIRCGKFEHVLDNFLNTNIFWRFKYISFALKVMKLSVTDLYSFSIYDFCNNVKIYELTEDKVNELISLREKIGLKESN